MKTIQGEIVSYKEFIVFFCTLLTHIYTCHIILQHSPPQIEFDIDSCDTISVLKQRICEREGIRPEQQKIFYLGKTLQNDKTIETYNIKGGDVLQLLVALRGGAK